MVHGLGGIGKTQLVVEYAFAYRSEYTAVLWVSADTPEVMRVGIAGLTGDAALRLPERAQDEQAPKVEAVLRWLREHERWLLILDNADTKDAVRAAEQLRRAEPQRLGQGGSNYVDHAAYELHQLIEESTFPWWSDPRARLAFFRPLTSLTLWFDHHAWPSSPALMHLHSLLWFALLLTVVGAVYRRFSSGQRSHGFAGVALMLFAFDDAHAMTVGWIANRGALMALTFGCAALLAHDSWRVSGRARSLAAAVALLALACNLFRHRCDE